MKQRILEFFCWLTGHSYMTDWETHTILGFETQHLRELRCTYCGKVIRP
jgi:hypothetical protein